MKITFSIKYNTLWGQKLYITGTCPELGNNAVNDAKEMHYVNEGEWILEINLTAPLKKLDYRFIIEEKNSIRRSEEDNLRHHIVFENGYDSYYLHDYWMTEPADRTFYTSAFTNNLFARQEKKTKTNKAGKKESIDYMSIYIKAPEILPGQVVAITGNQPCLGNWNINQALILNGEKFPQWEIRLDQQTITFPLEYKFLVLNNQTHEICYWEEGENRIIHQSAGKNKYRITIHDFPLRTPEHSWKACGTVIPVFSLRSDESFGIGDIGDIRKLIDWANKTGQHIIQILPMNDTTRTHTWKDSYPYSAISIYALHPLYISIPMLGCLNNKRKNAYFRKMQRQLNANETLDYQSVETYKTKYYREFFKQEAHNILNDIDFLEFISKNKEWLIPYAAFSYLRDKYNTANFSDWGGYAVYNRKKIESFCQPENEAYEEFSYQFFIQYTLHQQFEEIAAYARKNRVILKGDIPIGINRESVEAWIEPHYFNMKEQTGAPPDDFSDTGQNWSFPTYNWEVMERDGFAWWIKRFRKMNLYFDSFRIDHILGFFRIWEIPWAYTEGLCGHFRPALPLTIEEIERYGIKFDERWLTPRIHTKYLTEIFGEYTDYSTYQFFNNIDAEHLTLNEAYATQRKIKRFFEDAIDQKSQKIRDGLMTIANEVLFLQDPYNTNCYHPRISAYKSYAYRELSDENRHAFDSLYTDFFFRRHNEFWKETALKRLTPLINSTNMLVCGEDLGMIPDSVHEVMSKLQIFTLELERTPKVSNREFSDLATLPYHSVCTTSTHDMNPIRTWWKEDREKTQRYYNNILNHEGEAPAECPSEIAEEIIRHHLKASSMLTIIPLQDWFAMDDTIKRDNANDERINIPANPDNYWCYRMHISLESLIQTTSFNEKVKKLITGYGR